jgi:hypothetical protein
VVAATLGRDFGVGGVGVDHFVVALWCGFKVFWLCLEMAKQLELSMDWFVVRT